MKNNLFNYATSELSQDAFVCWLMSYAMDESRNDNGLRNCAVKFLKEFVPPLSDLDDENIFVTKIQRQYLKIDVLIVVNDEYYIIIEDKTNTSEHDDQLIRYKNDLSKADNISPDRIFGVYFKTGFESDTEKVNEAGYLFFDRKKILSVLNESKNETQNDIFLDYVAFYNNFEEEVQMYRELTADKWDWKMSLGFFNDLKNDAGFNCGVLTGEIGYGYVNNPSGGFYGMWLYPEKQICYGEAEFYPYLQVELGKETRLCFKIFVKKDSERFQAVDIKNKIAYNNNVEWKYDLEQLGYTKPKSLRSGKTMTIGFWGNLKQQPNCREIITALNEAIADFESVIEFCESKLID